MRQRPNLAVRDRAVGVFAVHVRTGDAEDILARPAVAGHAVGPAWEHPVLPVKLSGRLGIGHAKDRLGPGGADQLGVGLCLVPSVRVADPLVLLAQHDPSLHPERPSQAAMILPLD